MRSLLAEVLSREQLEEFEREKELQTRAVEHDVGVFRLSCFFQRGTPAMVARYIPVDIPNFDTLGLPPILKDVIMEKRGLILMVGATGSGKSTTLTSMIDFRNENASGHILTLEDPLEFLFKNKKSIVNQREVGTDTKAYQIALKNALRQAPDVIFIGEDSRQGHHEPGDRLCPVRPPVHGDAARQQQLSRDEPDHQFLSTGKPPVAARRSRRDAQMRDLPASGQDTRSAAVSPWSKCCSTRGTSPN